MITLSDFSISKAGRNEMAEVLESGRLTYGPKTREFERQWADLHGVRHAIFTNSGTSALVLAIAALKAKWGWVDGSEVIVPALTFVATANALIHNRLVPVVVDVEPVRMGISAQAIQDAITPSTVGIIPVHLMGRPCFMDEVKRISKEFDLAIIEDSCEAVGSRLNGVSVGGWGEAACFSTYAAHPISTGVGGLVTADSESVASMVRSLMNHGRDPSYLSIDDKDPDPVRQWRIVSNRFKFNYVGHSFRATELESVIGLDQLRGWGNSAEVRRAIGRLLDGEVGGNFMADPETIPMNYPITLRDPATKGRVVRALEDAGVQTRDLPTLLGQPCYIGNDLIRFTETPEAKRISYSTLYVGCHQEMTGADCSQIGQIVRGAINGKTAQRA